MYPFWYGCKHYYGYPAGGPPVESDVVFQTTMTNNGSDQLVDVVNDVLMSEVGVGSPTYDQVPTGGGVFGLLSPGVYYPDYARHQGDYSAGELDLARDEPRTIEMWVQGTEWYTDGVHGIIHISGSGSVFGGNTWIISGGGGIANGLYWHQSTTEGGLFGAGEQVTLTQEEFDLADDKPHHVRFVFDPSGVDTSYIAIDGDIIKYHDMTRLAGKASTGINRVTIGSDATEDTPGNPASGTYGSIFEVRGSNNATNNSYKKR